MCTPVCLDGLPMVSKFCLSILYRGWRETDSFLQEHSLRNGLRM